MHVKRHMSNELIDFLVDEDVHDSTTRERLNCKKDRSMIDVEDLYQFDSMCEWMLSPKMITIVHQVQA